MLRASLVALYLATALTVTPVLGPTDAYACLPKSAAEQKKREHDYVVAVRQAHAREIAAINEALPKATLSDADRAKVEELRAKGTHLHKAGNVSEVDKVVRQALKMLGLPLQPRPFLLRGC